MTEFILHHYDLSPYSEKIRLAFGLKNLDWHSVETPFMWPKPDLVPLTGGYRRAPVMQIGADIYCDSLLILQEIERRQPEPTLYPWGQRGMANALSMWWDKTTFFPAVKLATAVMGDRLPPEFLEERKTLMNHDFGKTASTRELPLHLQRVHAALAWLLDMLKDKPFALGDKPSAVDLTAYHALWFARKNGGVEAEAYLPLDKIGGWMERIGALGHGHRHAMSAEAALVRARQSVPVAPQIRPDADPSGLKPGQHVTVRADDYAKEPVVGTLVAADAEEVIVRRENHRAGTVHVHFPRAGFDVLAG